MTDPITDMLNQIRNAEAVAKTEVLLPFSKLKNQIGLILAEEGFVQEVKKLAKDKNKVMKIVLKYDNGVRARRVWHFYYFNAKRVDDQ